jgi:hypothetical protein
MPYERTPKATGRGTGRRVPWNMEADRANVLGGLERNYTPRVRGLDDIPQPMKELQALRDNLRGNMPAIPTLPQTVEMQSNIKSYGGNGRLDRGSGNNGIAMLGLFNGGFGDLGDLDPSLGVTIGDRQGLASNDPTVMKILNGHADAGGNEKYGEVLLAHGKDSVELGSAERATTWLVLERSAPTTGSKIYQWSQSKKLVSLARGEKKTVTNGENTLSNTDVDIYITLLTAGPTLSETQSRDDAKAKATNAIAAAQGAVSSAAAQGADMSAGNKLMTDANTAFNAGDYKDATSDANQAFNLATNASLAISNQALAKQLSDAQKDPTLTADAKTALVTQIQSQIASNNADAAASKAGSGFAFGANIPTIGILGGIGLAIGIVAVLAMKKKR